MRNVGSVFGNFAVDGNARQAQRRRSRASTSCAAARPTARRVSPMRSSFSSDCRERALVARRERPGRRVLRPQGPRGDAAAVGQRRDRNERLPEIASAGRIPDRGCVNAMVDPHADTDPDRRFHSPSADSCWPVPALVGSGYRSSSARRHRIDPFDGNRVTRKRTARDPTSRQERSSLDRR